MAESEKLKEEIEDLRRGLEYKVDELEKRINPVSRIRKLFSK